MERDGREATPGFGAAVMATGVVSVGLHLVGVAWLSLVMLVVAAAAWFLLAFVFVGRLLGDRAEWRAEAETPASLTAVAGTAVLGVRLAQLGWRPVALTALLLAMSLWIVLLPRVITHLRWGAPGVAYLACVSTQALVVLSTALRIARPLALFGFFLGLILYTFVLTHFDFTQLRTGAGDHWVAGGAMAISSVAAAGLGLGGLASVLLAIALCWYAVLVACEARWPRPRYDVRRWATVFPLAMTAVAALATAAVTHHHGLKILGTVLLAPAVVAWTAVTTGSLRTRTPQPH